MRLKKTSFIFLAALVALLGVKNGAEASVIGNEVNTVIGGISASENMVLDVIKTNQLSYTPNSDNLDIEAYSFMSKRQRQLAKMKNKYAISDNELVYDMTNTALEDANFWIKPYVSFENVKTAGAKINTKTYGLYMGANSGIKELSNGWDFIWGGYVGYNGAYLKNLDDKMFQNGATLGLEAMFLKGNFFTEFDLSVGGASGSVKDRYDHMSMTASYMNGGISNRTGYNFEFADGKFIIQPNILTSYIFAHTFGHSKDFGAGMSLSIDNDSLNAVQLEPGINFIGNLDNGWQPYVGVSLVSNILSSKHVAPWYAAMPDMSTKPFIKYGAGLRKTWNDRCSTMIQAFVRNGGRNGVGIQGGLTFSLGK